MPLEPVCRKIINTVLASVDPARLVKECIIPAPGGFQIGKEFISLDSVDHIHVLGAGKGASGLFHGLETLLPGRIAGGIVVTPQSYPPFVSEGKITFPIGSHPVPGPDSMKAGMAMTSYIRDHIGPQDLVFFLLTGGASALITAPLTPLQMEDKIEVNRLLLTSGAAIEEINCVRKHLSAIKGGRLAEMIHPARVISLIVSDIVDSPLEHVGSGPSVGDSTTFADALAVLRKYQLTEKVSPQVMSLLERGIGGQITETPRPDADIFRNNRHFLLADNLKALEAGRACATAEGIPAHILTSRDKGEARQAAKFYGAVVKEILRTGQPFSPPVILLSGGELTVTVKGTGRGGRNMEFILAMLAELKEETKPFFLLSMGTDGIDGPTDAAGAWIDHTTMMKVRAKGLCIDDYLETNDSYSFFHQIGSLIKTGSTGTNVMDLRILYLPGNNI